MDSSDDEKLDPSMMEKEVQKVQEGSWKAGYAEGKDEIQKTEFQASFNKGYEKAFRISVQFGLLQGMLDALTARDESIGSFIRPVMEKLQSTKIKVTTLNDMPPETDWKELEEQYSAVLSDIKEEFVRLYPYGEEAAEKLLTSAEPK